MVTSSRARVMACEWPPRSQVLCKGVLAAFLVLRMGAVRLDGVAVSSDGSAVVGSPSRASVPLERNDSAAARAQRERILRLAANYIDSVEVKDYFELGTVRDILELYEHIREKVLSLGASRDPRHRLQIRNILRDLREKGEALTAWAGKLEAEGQVDDGGDELPTQRDNICRRISTYRVEKEFLEMVQLFCESLDTVRKAVNAGEDEEPMAYCVSGLSSAMAIRPDYRQGNIGLEIQQVLGEERRWVAKHLAPPPAGTGNASPSSEGGTTCRFRWWDLRAWETQIWEEVGVDTPALSLKALQAAQEVMLGATGDSELTLGSVHTLIQKIGFCRGRLAKYISRSDPAFREQVREAFQEMEARMHALGALAARKLAAGEVDNTGELLPSQRDNICTKLDERGLEEDFRENIRKFCGTLDKLRVVVKIEVEKDKGVFELLGRMAALRRRPDYSDMPVASEVEHLFAEEWTWLAQQEAVQSA